MQTCNRCKHAFYCCAACQKACWKAHKFRCAYFKRSAEELQSPAGVCFLRSYLPFVMRVRPRPCR